MIYFCADLHFGHTNICKGTTKWSDKKKCRNFNTIEEMNNAIVKSINSVVGKNDTLYHIGDWSFGGYENIWNLRKQIVCDNIIQINGNHDKFFEQDKFFPFLEKQDGIIYEISDKTKYRSFGMLKNKSDVTVKDLFKEIHPNVLVTTINKQQIVLSHFPFEFWLNSESGTWHLHGHLHHDIDNNKINVKNKRMDVGWNGKVYSFDEIKSIMDKKQNLERH